ncbi:hypothetical protein AB0J52_13820 [Spirillospora sp. NPDC049652]
MITPARALYAGAIPLSTFFNSSTPGLIAVLAAVSYVAISMIGNLLLEVAELMQTILSDARLKLEKESLPGELWIVTLFHQRAPDRAQELAEKISSHRRKILTELGRKYCDPQAIHIGSAKTNEPIVFQLDRVTDENTRKKVQAITHEVRLSNGSRPRFAALGADAPLKAQEGGDLLGGGAVLTYLASCLFMTVYLAWQVGGAERDACAHSSCTGRPASFHLALRWAFERAFLHDPNGITPATNRAFMAGLGLSLMWLMAIPVSIRMITDKRKSWNMARKNFLDALDRITSPTRVLILVTTDTEREAVLTAAQEANNSQEIEPQHLKQSTVFPLGKLRNTVVTLAQFPVQGSRGLSSASDITRTLIDELDPDFVLLTGICFGLKEQEIGSILVATQVRLQDHKRITDSPNVASETVELGRGSRPDPSPLLLSRATAATHGWTGKRVFRGPMISLNAVVDSVLYRDRLIKEHPDALGGEMECAAVYEAAASARRDWLMIKAVSDHAAHKRDSAQELAAREAARFVVHVLRQGGLDVRPDLGNRGASEI